MWIIRASVRLRKLSLSLLREEAASEPAAWLPAAVVSVVDAPPQAVSIIAVQSTTAAVFFMVFLLFLSFEIIFLRVDRISAPAMDH